MCCLAEFLVKYSLIIVNIIFALIGLAIIGLGTAAHIQINEIYELFPVNLQFLSISIITIGCIVFVISFCACCGAIIGSRIMLISYAVFMGILAGIKIYITVVIFGFLDNALGNVSNWLTIAFARADARNAYNVMEMLFQCCGTNGPDAYPTIGLEVPPSCCYNPDLVVNQCTLMNSYGGCITKVGNYFENFGGAIGAVLITVIVVECICVIFGLFLACQIKNKRNK